MTQEFRPFVRPEEQIREFTPLGVLVGVLLGSLFAAANAYVGLKVGLTVSASIPVAVVSMAILRSFKGTLLENNMAQTVGSAGESLVAGIVFTLPALYLWGETPTFFDLALTTGLGGVLGVLFMIPLRRFLIVQEHHNLPYPEGTACAEVLKAGQSGGGSASRVFAGLGLGALYAAGFKIWGRISDHLVGRIHIGDSYHATVSINSIPSLLAVGYILGIRVGGMMMAGAALGWLVIMPLLAFIGDHTTGIVPPSETDLGELKTGGLRDDYIRYIGAGAVTFGGLFSLCKTLARFGSTFLASMRRRRERSGPSSTTLLRTQQDLSSRIAIGIGLTCIAALWAFQIVSTLWAAIAIVLFAGIFVAVSSQIVGLVGASSNPVSGMTITTLLGTALLLSSHGAAGIPGMVQTISVGAVVCIAACTAGDTSQDLKTGFLLGATPRYQQIGELIGTLSAALALTIILPFILTLPGPDGPLLNVMGANPGVAAVAEPEFQAPQANIMKTLVEGVFQGDLPWVLIFIGMAAALVVELLGAPSLPFAVGLYLPFGLSSAIFTGGVLRWIADKARGVQAADQGILTASGLIAGEALIGLAWIGYLWKSKSENRPLMEFQSGTDLWTTVAFLSLMFFLFLTTGTKSKKNGTATDAHES